MLDEHRFMCYHKAKKVNTQEVYMEIRVLQYFMAVVREQNISKAAEAMHLTQPTLSRQLHDLEEELGHSLFIRGSRKMVLTEEGMILRRRAEEILSLVKITEEEIALSNETVAGEITIGAGETKGLKLLAESARKMRERFPDVSFHIHSGDDEDVLEELDHGLIDFALLFDTVEDARYDFQVLPHSDSFGVLLRRDSPLAAKSIIKPDDLWDQPLIVSRATLKKGTLLSLLGRPAEKLIIAGTYNLLYNGSLMVEEGLGCALGFDWIINVSGESNLCFRPLSNAPEYKVCLIWKKYQEMSKAAGIYLEQIKKDIRLL